MPDRYCGMKHVEHDAVHGADNATRQGYLERAYALSCPRPVGPQLRVDPAPAASR